MSLGVHGLFFKYLNFGIYSFPFTVLSMNYSSPMSLSSIFMNYGLLVTLSSKKRPSELKLGPPKEAAIAKFYSRLMVMSFALILSLFYSNISTL